MDFQIPKLKPVPKAVGTVSAVASKMSGAMGMFSVPTQAGMEKLFGAGTMAKNHRPLSSMSDLPPKRPAPGAEEIVKMKINKVKPMKKIAIFIDIQNIYYTVKETFNSKFNYRALWKQLSELGEICIANAYATDKQDPKQIAFQDVLKSIGFEVKLKPYINRTDGSSKGDWDVGIAIDVMDVANHSNKKIDTIVLLSGDGDFDLLLKRVSRNNEIDTLVYGVRKLTAESLIKAADMFIEIDRELLLD